MLTTLRLHGDLSRFGEVRELDICTPGEALRAVEALRPGFIGELRKAKYAMIIQSGSSVEAVTPERAALPISGETLHVIPVPSGNIETAIYWVANALYTYIGVTAATAVATVAVTLAASYALASIAAAIMPMPEMGDPNERPESKPSFYFDGPVNTTKQGNVVPLCYGGPILIGSQVISASITTEDLAINA